MPLITIVEDYVLAAMRRAVFERLEGGTIAATVPEAFGVVAFGGDGRECLGNLYERLADWALVSLERGYELPVLDDIDLNSEMRRILNLSHGAACCSCRDR